VMDLGHRVMSPAIRAKPVRAREKIRLENWLQYQFNAGLGHPVADRRDGDFILPLLQSRVGIFPRVWIVLVEWLGVMVPGGTDILW